MTDEELAVLEDQRLERGEVPSVGALQPLFGKGLTAEFTHGFPTALTFNLGASLVRDALTQLTQIILTDPALQHVRRIELHLTPDVHAFAADASKLQSLVLENPPASLRSFSIIELDEPAFEDLDHADESRLFAAPNASSWFTEEES